MAHDNEHDAAWASTKRRADMAVDDWQRECTDGRVTPHTDMMVRQFAYHAFGHMPQPYRVFDPQAFAAEVNAAAPKVASDAAVPAGEPFGYWVEHKYAEPVFLRGPAYDPEPSDLRVITPLYAAAPKVASDTGAGLRETAQAAHRALYNLQLAVVQSSPPDVMRAMLAAAKEAEFGIRAALATPTDATDGATGGGEEWTFTPDEREKAAILSLCADQELSPTAVMRQALRLYQHDHCRRKDGETVKWSGDAQRARDFAGPLATTPGGDLLEQAARLAEDGARHATLAGIAADDEAKGDGLARVLQAVARDIRALNTAGKGEGGE